MSKSIRAQNKSGEENLHWTEEKEVISSNRPLKFVLHLINSLPPWLVHFFVFPVAVFFFLFSKRARTECVAFQKQLKAYTKGEAPRKISAYRPIVSFSLCVVEKMEAWLGKYRFEDLVTHDDDLGELIELLNQGKGAVIIGAHLGSFEFLRSLSCQDSTGVKRAIPVMAIMKSGATEQFNKTIQEINPSAALNLIDPSDITPESMEKMQNTIESGGLVVFTADRTSENARTRFLRRNFLGKEAEFPYGVFLLAALLNAPMYYMFALRTKTAALHPKYNMFVERSVVNFDCPRKERESRINTLCTEFVSKLENYAICYPYQWYNFYNFWLQTKTENGGEQ